MLRQFVLALAVSSMLSFSQPAAAQDGAPADSPEVAAIKKMFEAHRAAFSNHDIEKVITFYADDAVMIGTGPGELWVGHEEIADAYKHFCEDFEKGTQRHKITWQHPKLKGDVAWLVLTLEENQVREGETAAFHLNMSVVLEKTGGEWKFSTIHFSNLTGGE